MNKPLLILGIALGIGTTACANTGRAVRGSTTASAMSALAANSPSASYRDVSLGTAPPKPQSASGTPAQWPSLGSPNAPFPLFSDSNRQRTAESTPARWYRIAPQHPLMSDGTGQQPAMLPR